jgi:predicted transcriptional regulator
MRQQMNGQLRVRIDEHVHQKLALLADKRAKSGTVSDVVRDAIEAYIARQEEHPRNHVLSSETIELLTELAGTLQRSPTRVLEDCVEGIHVLSKSDTPPLIVMELKLRQTYFSKRVERPTTADSEKTTTS